MKKVFGTIVGIEAKLVISVVGYDDLQNHEETLTGDPRVNILNRVQFISTLSDLLHLGHLKPIHWPRVLSGDRWRLIDLHEKRN